MPASKPKKKNFPDALSRDAETLPLCCDFVVGELASVSVAVAFFGVFGPSSLPAPVFGPGLGVCLHW